MQKLKPISAFGINIISKKICEYKNKQRISYWTNEYKNFVMKEIHYNKKNYRIPKTMEILPKLECNEKWKQTGNKKSTKNNQKPDYHLHT